MSTTIPNDDAQQAAATEPSQTELEPETRTDPAPGADTTTPPTEAKPADDTKSPDPRDRAIRQLAFEQRETRRQLQAARQELQRAQPPRDPNTPPSPADIDRMVAERAEALNAQKDAQAKSEAWIAAGNAEYADFTAQCNALADMGAGDNPVFMDTIGKLPAGHKVIAELARDPFEAARVLKLSPIDLALELAGISQRIASTPPAPPKPVSRAPEPIRPLATAARAEANLNNLDGDAFRDAWNKRTRSK